LTDAPQGEAAAAPGTGAPPPSGAFPNPFEVETPEGAEGWQRLYPYYFLFDEARRDFDEGKFWFFDGMHYAEPVYPFDTIMPESTWVILNQFTTRYFVVPPALGIDHRILNGYIYASPRGVEDPEEIARRAELFGRRAGHYYGNWDELYEKWEAKANDCIDRLKAIHFEPLPDLIPEEDVLAARSVTQGHDLLTSYSELIANFHEMAYHHFEMLGLGYGAYLVFVEFCRKTFPGIADQTVAKMVAGIDILMFRPDDELRKLARLALELGVADVLAGETEPEPALERMADAPRGQEWLDALEEARDPWFWFSTGTGLSHSYPSWNDDLTLPFSVIRSYIATLEQGGSIERPLEDVQAERERLTAEYRALLQTDEDRAAFDDLVTLAATVYPFVENHNFYCEHVHYSIFWNKVRELGRVFAAAGYLEDAEDIFLLHRWEIYPAIWDLKTSWGTGGAPDRRDRWRDEIAERKRILEALRRWSPPPALGKVPESLNEPFTVMLWGITDETVERWLGASDGDGSGELRGVAASPGVAEGPARVIFSPDQLDEVEVGEILVCPITAPSWAPIFAKIGGAVSDIGGIMAHAAIVSREYGLPAVVGTGFGTRTIKTGQRIRVDGDNGVVTILD
jgi:pyruvate, water dikinase